MRPSGSVARVLAIAAVAVLAAACSSGEPGSSQSNAPVSRGPTPSPSPIALTDYPSGFPTVYTHEVDPGPTLLTPVDGGLRHDASGTLRADDGTTGTYTATWVENRISAVAVQCGGLDYPALFTTEVPDISMEVDFPDWGRATLVASDRILVFQSSRNGSSPAVCDQVNGGTYEFEFTVGPIKQLMSGTFSLDADGRLVFDAPLASPGSSPSEGPG